MTSSSQMRTKLVLNFPFFYTESTDYRYFIGSNDTVFEAEINTHYITKITLDKRPYSLLL